MTKPSEDILKESEKMTTLHGSLKDKRALENKRILERLGKLPRKSASTEAYITKRKSFMERIPEVPSPEESPNQNSSKKRKDKRRNCDKSNSPQKVHSFSKFFSGNAITGNSNLHSDDSKEHEERKNPKKLQSSPDNIQYLSSPKLKLKTMDMALNSNLKQEKVKEEKGIPFITLATCANLEKPDNIGKLFEMDLTTPIEGKEKGEQISMKSFMESSFEEAPEIAKLKHKERSRELYNLPEEPSPEKEKEEEEDKSPTEENKVTKSNSKITLSQFKLKDYSTQNPEGDKILEEEKSPKGKSKLSDFNHPLKETYLFFLNKDPTILENKASESTILPTSPSPYRKEAYTTNYLNLKQPHPDHPLTLQQFHTKNRKSKNNSLTSTHSIHSIHSKHSKHWEGSPKASRSRHSPSKRKQHQHKYSDNGLNDLLLSPSLIRKCIQEGQSAHHSPNKPFNLAAANINVHQLPQSMSPSSRNRHHRQSISCFREFRVPFNLLRKSFQKSSNPQQIQNQLHQHHHHQYFQLPQHQHQHQHQQEHLLELQKFHSEHAERAKSQCSHQHPPPPPSEVLYSSKSNTVFNINEIHPPSINNSDRFDRYAQLASANINNQNNQFNYHVESPHNKRTKISSVDSLKSERTSYRESKDESSNISRFCDQLVNYVPDYSDSDNNHSNTSFISDSSPRPVHNVKAKVIC